MPECLPDLPRYVRERDNEWEGADHPDGPWRPIPAPQSGLPWDPSRRGSNPPPPGNKPAPPASPPAADLALRVQRLEAMLETEKAALLDAFRQIDELRRRLDFQYSKLNKLEEDLSPLRLMTDPTPLSPAAQAVLDAVFDHWPGGYNHPGKPRCVAAALRAAAVQVDAVNVPDHIRGDAYWAHRNGRAAAEGHLLRIAAELEGFNV